jgi:Zn-dependent M28 family amino/carboxypeptidase
MIGIDIWSRGAACAALLVLAGCATTAAPPQQSAAARQIEAADLMRHASILAADSMEGRLIGTPGSDRARAYLRRAFAEAGLQPIGAAGFEHVAQQVARDSTVRQGINLVGVIRGTVSPDQYIVLTAHYDHVGVRNGETYNGADDNASGTGAILELARWFSANRPRHSILVVAFDGEEGGMVGSRSFVAAPPVPSAQLVVNINLDMVGRNVRNELYASGTHHYPVLRTLLDSVATRAPVTLRFGHDDPAGPSRDDWTSQSDHASFHRAGIPFVYFGVEDHPDYHRPTDTADRLMPAFYAGAVNTVRDALQVIDRNLAAVAAARRP